jgi:hypothetical protein
MISPSTSTSTTTTTTTRLLCFPRSSITQFTSPVSVIRSPAHHSEREHSASVLGKPVKDGDGVVPLPYGQDASRGVILLLALPRTRLHFWCRYQS